jgi:endogenous inhibitor of DNA gyrase (YacG/DUF329 family)
MTLVDQATVTCPACGTDFKTEIISTVNVSIDPKLKSRVLDGSLFDHDCPKCGKLSRLGHNVLYHDMERRFQVDVRPMGNPPDAAAVDLAGIMLDGPVGQGYRLRWVVEAFELAEKVRVFDAKLDDRLVELLKVWAIVNTEELEQPLTFGRMKRDGIEFLTPGGDVLPVAYARYEALREHFAAKLEADRGWRRIDGEFALGVLGLGPRADKQPTSDQLAQPVELLRERGQRCADDRHRAKHDALVRWTAGFAVFAGLLGWIFHERAIGLALLGSWLLIALLFAICPPKPDRPSA